MKKLLILMLLGVLFVPMNGSAKADEVLYCQSELATGMVKKNGTWNVTPIQEQRYTIKFIGDFEGITGLYPNKIFKCKVTFPRAQPDRFVCNMDYGLTYIYDKNSKRFVYANITLSTYLDTDTPAVVV